MSKHITVLGAGPGGYAAAIRASQLGARVTLIERESIGGTCLNRGCIPTKTVGSTAELMRGIERARELGVEIHGEIRLVMERLAERRHRVIRNTAANLLKTLENRGIRYLRGNGTVVDPKTVRVNLSEGGTLRVASDGLILAPGSKPANLPGFPFDGEQILSSSHALGLPRIPESILIVGGGVVGCEFALIFSCLGAKVTLVEAMPRVLPLPGLDSECATILLREMRKRNIQTHLDCAVRHLDVMERKVRVSLEPSLSGGGTRRGRADPLILEVERVLIAIGREPNSSGMGLEQLGLEMDRAGWIEADDRMKTNIPCIYAIGDVLGPSRLMLAHAASAEGAAAAENAMGGSRRIDYRAIPTAVFTSPEVAAVGLTEQQARDLGLETRSDTLLFRSLGRAQATGELAGQAKLVSESRTGRILGVHMVGARVTDLIAEAALAVRMGVTVEDLAQTVHPHPTFSEILWEVAQAARSSAKRDPKDGEKDGRGRTAKRGRIPEKPGAGRTGHGTRSPEEIQDR